MIFEPTANLAIASGCGNGECLGGASVKLDVEIHRQSGGIKSRTEIGGGGGKREAKRPLRTMGSGWHIECLECGFEIPAKAQLLTQS